MDLPFLKNDITNILGPQKPVIYSSNHRTTMDNIRSAGWEILYE
jgi:hypothetical protein